MAPVTTHSTKQKVRTRHVPRTRWQDLTWIFPDPLECLASFLALEAAEVLGGVKPANLVQLRNRLQPCGRNLHHLWHLHSATLLSESPLQALSLRARDNGDLMLFFSPVLLQKHLEHPETATFLHQWGYSNPTNVVRTLQELQLRFQAGPEMPHEIGIFLGYPLKDVAGFMGASDQPCTACRQWRIYGDPEPSLALSDRYTACRRGIAKRLMHADNPLALLQSFQTPRQKISG